VTNAQPLVRIERVEHVLVIEMCRADKRNAIDRAMADALDEALTLLDRDDDLRVGVLAADGPVFSAGSDLTAGGDYYTERGGEYGIITDRSARVSRRDQRRGLGRRPCRVGGHR
jgi:enoyl-CoA hydratase/carnithine racemase